MSVLLVALLPLPPKLTGESSRADETQRQINADSLPAVFDLVLTSLHYVSHEGMIMEYGDRKTRLCFPILVAWIADHAVHTTLHWIGSKSCPKCEVPCNELGGNPRKVYKVHDYAIYEEKARQLESGEAASTWEYFRQVGVKTGQNIFTALHRVNPSNLHKLNLLHNIYLDLFKHIMQWVQGFLKRQKRQQAFDDAWKEIPPYPGFSIPKKAYREVTQWQGKEMRNLSRSISAVLASALRNPDSFQHREFPIALQYVSPLVDFSLMAQYRSHTPDTLSYLERYLLTFHQTKAIFLEFRTSKATRAEANRQHRELRNKSPMNVLMRFTIPLRPNGVSRRIKRDFRGLIGKRI